MKDSLSKIPNNVRNLDIAIRRYAGNEEKYVDLRNLVSNVVVGQLMPDGVIKGGSSLKFRFGSDNTRFTKDFDFLVNMTLINLLTTFKNL